MPRGWVWFSLMGVSLSCMAVAAGLPQVGAGPALNGTLEPWAFLPLVFHEVPPTPTATATPKQTPTATPTLTPAPSLCHLGYGANLSDHFSVAYLVEMGFGWAKGFADPADRENSYGAWKNVANQLDGFLGDEAAEPRVHHVLLRIRAPGYTPPPLGQLSGFQERCHDLAAFVRANYSVGGRLETIAYEIWNEPNLTAEWGGPPNPSEYVALLAAAYQGIKAADPEALVVSAGLATGGDYDDLAFLEDMYRAGGDAYFDALGSHPYGGDTSPGQKNAHVYFRRAEEQRGVMVASGDAGTPIWATEFSWIVERPENCPRDDHAWAEVTEQQQADYLVAAFQYADEHWPWMGPMFLMLDFGITPYYETECEPLRWYSIYYRPWKQWTAAPIARPAVSALTAMQKCSAWE